jgi:hypothetical protein
MRGITLAFLWVVSFCTLNLLGWIVAKVLEGVGGGPVDFLLDAARSTPWAEGHAYILLVAALATFQVAFIAPLVGPLRLQATGRSLRTTVIGAAGLAAAMTIAMVWGIAQVVALYTVGEPGSGKPRMEADVPDWASWLFDIDLLAVVPLLAAWLVVGGIWTAVLWRAGASRDPDDIGRFARKLLAGSGIELVLSIPLFILARRRMNCYCALGNFWGIVLGLAGIFWLCGPWAVLLLTREDRRNWARGACAGCGYPKRSGSGVCSECGRPH